jgi:hypothetical protein
MPTEAVVERDGADAGSVSQSGQLISIDELQYLWRSGAPVVVLDVRTERTFAESDLLATKAIRLNPDQAVEGVRRQHLSTQAWLVAFCT